MIFLIESLMQWSCPHSGVPKIKFIEFPNRICNEIDLSGPRSSRSQKSMISLIETLKRIELSGHARQLSKIDDFLFGIFKEIKVLGQSSS